MAEFRIRQAQGNDLSFIYNTFLTNYKRNSPIGQACRAGIFFDYYCIVIDDLLNNSKIYVACHNDDDAVMFGYLIADKDILHYCFVKEAFRRLGIATELYKEALKEAHPQLGFLCTTHKTFKSERIKSLNIPYNPFALYSAIRKRDEHGKAKESN